MLLKVSPERTLPVTKRPKLAMRHAARDAITLASGTACPESGIFGPRAATDITVDTAE